MLTLKRRFKSERHEPASCWNARIGAFNISVRSTRQDVLNDFAGMYPRRADDDPTDRTTIRMEIRPDGRSAWSSGRYVIAGDGEDVFKDCRQSELLPYLEWAVNRRVIARCSNYLQLHAASMAWGDSGFIFAGNSGAGKSTLAAGLSSRGWGYFCDEFALISPGSLHVHPFPKAICIKAGSFDVVRRLGLPLWKRLYSVRGLGCRVGYIETNAATSGSVMASQPVRYVIFPRFIAGAPTRLYPVSRGQAAFALRYHVLNAAAIGQRTVPILTDVARGARCFGLEFGDLGAACGMLESLDVGTCHSRRAAV